ncbi:MAG TPA: HAMP domain-containing sensor histidine kinase, partial [Candidatus Saccharimonas sp.]|nr:HAMP domain-containing sensor histidine kinase [Candidatus Saccharimonas sp.]
LTAGAQLEQMKVDFVALAAHELRTPLTELKGYLDILQSEAKGLTKDNRDFLARSVESAAQLSGLMNNLLGVARIEHGELNYQPEDIDYLAFLRDLEHELHERFDAQERTLTLRLPDELPDLRVDVIGLREILLNLINNAVSHTERGKGVVTLSVTKHRDTIQTSVTDNGTGIPADAMPHLFTKFFRVGEMSATSRGTGLGLYICRSIVEAHGGKIWAESTEGKGATFTFRLPMEPVAENPDQQDNNPKITRGAHGWIKEHTVH